MFFGFHNNSQVNYSATFYVEEVDSLFCSSGGPIETNRWLRSLLPIAATMLILCGCTAVAYWGYDRMTHPEEAMYKIVGERPLIIENF
jgi:hypothetical protein